MGKVRLTLGSGTSTSDIVEEIRSADRENYQRQINLSAVRAATKGPEQIERIIESIRSQRDKNMEEFKSAMEVFDRYVDKLQGN